VSVPVSVCPVTPGGSLTGGPCVPGTGCSVRAGSRAAGPWGALATHGRDTAVVRWLDSRNLKDAIVVPLQSGANIMGTVTVTDRLGDTATFTSDDLKMLQTLTSHSPWR
jgi:hypothetical protein